MAMLKLAVQSPRYAAMAKLPNGMLITKERALAAGYTVAKSEEDATSIRATSGELSGAGNSYLDALLALPEAKERPLAASRIAALHTVKSMPIAKAAMFLSGLPSELATTDDASGEACPPEVDALLRRRAELHLYTLDKKAIQGDREAKKDAIAIRYGLEVHRSSNLQCIAAFKAAGVNLGRLSDQTKHMGN